MPPLETDDDFDSGFSATLTPPPVEPPPVETPPTETPPPVETPPTETPPPVEPPPAEDETIVLKKSDWEALQQKADRLDKAFGKMGGIERTVNELKAATTPRKIEVTEEIVSDIAKEFPELAENQLGAFRRFAELLSAVPVPAAPGTPSTTAPEAPTVDAKTIALQIRREVASETLDETHSDWREVIGLPDANNVIPDTEYRRWLNKQPEAYRNTVTSSHNPVTIGRSIDEFRKAKAKDDARREQLQAGINPRGTGGSTTSTPSADDEFNAGFRGD